MASTVADCLGQKTVSVSMLGGFQLSVGERTLTDDINRSRKLWSVLCYLIIHRARTIPQSELIEHFWPEEDRSSPVSALKTLLYRIRAMLEPLFAGEINPILARQGAYQWNPDLVCQVDAERFEALCRQARGPGLTDTQRMECYRQATDLYRSNFLPKQGQYMWVISLNVHYHAMYIDAVKAYAALLEQSKQFDSMYTICTKASQQETLDEEIYVYMIRALLNQGKELAALSQYTAATDLLYRNLGVYPSDELRSLYNEIMKIKHSVETDLETIQEDLREAYFRPGAFVCEYGFFKEAYRLEARRMKRNGLSVHVALLTVSLKDLETPPLDMLNSAMEMLLDILILCLRRGDLVSRFSGAQYVLLLHAANFENSLNILERISASFRRQCRKYPVKLSYKIRELDFTK